jgi:hypothetical protein
MGDPFDDSNIESYSSITLISKCYYLFKSFRLGFDDLQVFLRCVTIINVKMDEIRNDPEVRKFL